MLRFLKNVFGIIIGAVVLFLMIKLPLSDIPYLQYILAVLIIGVIFFYCGKLYCLSHPSKKRKDIFKVIVLALLLSISGKSFAGGSNHKEGSFGYYWSAAIQTANDPVGGAQLGKAVAQKITSLCEHADTYYKKTIGFRAQNWKNDENCFQARREQAEEIVQKNRLNASGFVPPEEFTQERLRNPNDGKTFRQAPNWDEWVSEKFSGNEEFACAVVYVNLCSAYDERHPKPKARTVIEILREDTQKSGCWPCKMASIFLIVAQALSVKLNTAMCEAGLNFLKIIMLIWMLYAVLQAVVFPSKGPEFIKNLFVRFLCMIMAIMLLANQTYLQQLYKYFLTPFLNLGIGMSQEINESLLTVNSFGERIYKKVNVPAPEDYCIVSDEKLEDRELIENAVFVGPELRTSLLCMVQRLYRQIEPITAIGQSIVSYSIQTESSFAKWFFNLPDMQRWMIGWTIVILFSLYSFSVAFRIIDIFVKFGFILVLMPLFVAATVFPATREFTKKAFVFLMKTITDFLALTIAVNFILVVFETVVGEGANADVIQLAGEPESTHFEDVILVEEGGDTYINNLMTLITSDGTWSFFFFLIALFLFASLLLKTSIAILADIFSANTAVSLDIGASVVSTIQQGISLANDALNLATEVGSNSGEKETKEGLKAAKKMVSSSDKKSLTDKAGDAVNSAAKTTGKTIDKAGTKAGKALCKTKYGAVIGVPMIVAAKTTNAGIRVTGKAVSLGIKAAGRAVSFAKRSFNKIKGKKKK